MSEKTEDSATERKSILPLFGIAAVLMAVGFFFALSPEGEPPISESVDASAGRASNFAEAPPTSGAAVVGLEMKLLPGARAWKVDLRQSTVRAGKEGAKALESHLTFLLRDTPVPGEDGLVFERAYEDVRIDVMEDGKPLAATTAAQVGELVKIAKHRVRFDEHGRILEHTLTSSGGASMRQVVGLISDAAMMLSLRLPAEPVNEGEEWSYRSPFTMDGGDGASVDGAFQIANSVIGKAADDEGLAVIEQKLRSEGSGKFESPDGSRVDVQLNGAGKGIFWFDAEAGMMRRVELKFDQVSSLGTDGFGVQTSTELSLEPASGE